MIQVRVAEKEKTPHSQLRDELLKMSSEELNLWLLQDPSKIEKQYPGYLSGMYLFLHYDEAEWQLQDPEHINNVLYAGCKNFEDLELFTTERIESLIRYVSHDEVYHMNQGNIGAVLRIVSHLMNGEVRRTGEPSIGHIYRTTLRIVELIEIFNDLAASRGQEYPMINSLAAEFLICTAIMHDFLEDRYVREGKEVRGGIIQNSEEGIRFITTEDHEIDAASSIVDFGSNMINDGFLRGLEALDSSKSPQELMEHLAREVEEMYQRFGQRFDETVLYLVSSYLVKSCDRLDKNATYFKSPEKIFEKCIENLRLFGDVLAVFQMCAGDEQLNKPEIAHLGRRYLHFLPDRVAKLLLAGFSPQEIYKRHENGVGIPRSM